MSNLMASVATAALQPASVPADPLFDTPAAGAYLGGDGNPISPRTLERWRQIGAGPRFVRVGGAVRYRKSALDEFLAAGEGKVA